MYKLENNVEWTDGLKNAFKHNVTRAKILYTGAEINEQNNLKDLTLTEQRYISNLGFIGTATARMLELNLVDIQNGINLENKELILKIGADYEGDTYYINYGNFIVDKPPENDATNGNIRVVAYDYMIKFNKPYVNRIAFPCTLLALTQDVCSQAEVALGSLDFINKDFVVQDNQFEGLTLREVLQNIAKCAFSWARIGQDNKLYLDFNLIPESRETITIDEYKTNSFKKANEYYGPVNQVTYADSDIQGQEARVKDQQSIDINGLKELVIYDNVFAYTPAKKQELIQGGAAILGLRYMPITQLDLIGLAYLDSRDIIEVGTLDEENFESRVFSHIIQYNGTLSDGITNEGTSNNEEAYKNTANNVYQDLQTRFIIDKANKRMDAVIEDVNGQNTKISQLTQTVDDLTAQISDISDITTYGESSYASVDLTDINESEPIMLKVHPTTQNISYLYPREGLYPSDTLYIPSRSVRFTRTYVDNGTTKTEYIDYELPDDLLVYNDTVYDEFYLDYESQTCQVTKRCKYNADGTVSALATEVVHTYSYPEILLGEGDYTISLLGYQYGYIYVRLMAKNIYTTQFYTKVETNSLIRQTVNSIDLSVNQKLTNYSTTSEMNSAINLKANEITSSVSEIYATKNQLSNYSTTTQMNSAINQKADSITSSVSATYVTKSNANSTYETKSNAQNTYATKSTVTQTANSLQSQITTNRNDISSITQEIDGVEIEVGKKYNTNDFTNAKITAKINDGTSNVQIKADKISLAGKTIDMTSENIAINSSNFKVDKNGNLTCSNANVNGKITSNDASITGGNVFVTDDGNQLTGNIKATNKNNSSQYTNFSSYGVNVYNGSRESGHISSQQFGVSRTDSNNNIIDGIYATLYNSTYGVSTRFIVRNTNAITTIYPDRIVANGTTYNSKESMKKNIKLYNKKALDLIKESEIYEYNYKSEKDTDKKHIGFVIADEGGNYKTPDEVISAERDGIEQYNMTSILWKAVQEQQEEIEKLKQRLEEK